MFFLGAAFQVDFCRFESWRSWDDCLIDSLGDQKSAVLVFSFRPPAAVMSCFFHLRLTKRQLERALRVEFFTCR